MRRRRVKPPRAENPRAMETRMCWLLVAVAVILILSTNGA